jgi:uncharacterized protein YgiM (DUF1202 family)
VNKRAARWLVVVVAVLAGGTLLPLARAGGQDGIASIIYRYESGRVSRVEIYYEDGYYQELVPREEIPAPVETVTPDIWPTVMPTATPTSSVVILACRGRVLAQALNVRDAPTLDGHIIGQIYAGYHVDIEARLGNWYQIRYGGGSAYTHAGYVDAPECQ